MKINVGITAQYNLNLRAALITNYSLATFQSFIVLVFSSKELPMSTIFFPLAMYFAA